MNKNNEKWTVYKHTSPTGKVYVGITHQPVWGMMMDTMMRQAREQEEGKQDE